MDWLLYDNVLRRERVNSTNSTNKTLLFIFKDPMYECSVL